MTDFIIKIGQRIPAVHQYMVENVDVWKFLHDWNKTYNEPPQGYEDSYYEGPMLTRPNSNAKLS